MKKEHKYLSRTKKWHKRNYIFFKNKIRDNGGVYHTPFLETPEDKKCWTDFYFIENGIVYVVFATTLAYEIWSTCENKAYDEFNRLYEAKFGKKNRASWNWETEYDKSGHITGYLSKHDYKKDEEYNELSKEVFGKELALHQMINLLTKKEFEKIQEDKEKEYKATLRTEELKNNIAIHVILNVPFISPEVIKDFIENIDNHKTLALHSIDSVVGFEHLLPDDSGNYRA